jgi:hypothetical protein
LVTVDARRRTVVEGAIDGRAVRITLKIASREGDDERYVFRVAIHRFDGQKQGPIARTDLKLADRFRDQLSRRSPSISTDEHRWLRVAFRHLGKLDVLTVLDGLRASADALDERH